MYPLPPPRTQDLVERTTALSRESHVFSHCHFLSPESCRRITRLSLNQLFDLWILIFAFSLRACLIRVCLDVVLDFLTVISADTREVIRAIELQLQLPIPYTVTTKIVRNSAIHASGECPTPRRSNRGQWTHAGSYRPPLRWKTRGNCCYAEGEYPTITMSSCSCNCHLTFFSPYLQVLSIIHILNPGSCRYVPRH